MKILIIICIFCTALISCKKESVGCWECECAAVNGVPAHKETFCQDENPMIRGIDKNGNQSIVKCEK